MYTVTLPRSQLSCAATISQNKLCINAFNSPLFSGLTSYDYDNESMRGHMYNVSHIVRYNPLAIEYMYNK